VDIDYGSVKKSLEADPDKIQIKEVKSFELGRDYGASYKEGWEMTSGSGMTSLRCQRAMLQWEPMASI